MWGTIISGIDSTHPVFPDESGINIDMTRRYGRSKGKKRVVGSAPINTPKSTTLLSSVRLDVSTVPMVFQSALNSVPFSAENVLDPA